MSAPRIRVIIFENNATRADLYAHWLDGFDVEVVLTPRQAADTFDRTFVVAVLDEEFGDGAAENVLELIRSRNPDCQVITTSPNRDQVFPSLDVDHHFAKPVFEADLCEKVERLARRAVYSAALTEYYRLTVDLTSIEHGDGSADHTETDVERIERRANRLKATLAELAAQMDDDDVAAVLEDRSSRSEVAGTSPPPDSKYVPTKCAKCGQRWDGEEFDRAADGPVRIGSFVWRCRNCGHVQMHASPKEGQLAPFL